MTKRIRSDNSEPKDLREEFSGSSIDRILRYSSTVVGGARLIVSAATYPSNARKPTRVSEHALVSLALEKSFARATFASGALGQRLLAPR